MINSIFTAKDQNSQDETTIYWFDVVGTIGNEEDGVWGITDCNGEIGLVDCDGCPCNTDDAHILEVFNSCEITQEIMSDF